MHYLDEGNVDVNMVGYDIVNVYIRYCIVQSNDMKYNLGIMGANGLIGATNAPLGDCLLGNIFETFSKKMFNFFFKIL
jgi:hypothetical protein